MQGKHKQAMKLYLQAQAYAKKLENNRSLADTYSAIATSYTINENDSEALKYYHRAYIKIKELGDDLELAYLKVQMSRSYSYLYDNEKAISLAKEAVGYFNQNEYYFDELFAQSTLAKNYMSMEDYNNAIQVYTQTT